MTWQEDLNNKRLAGPGWYGCIAPDGWKEIILETNEMLAHMDPFYKITQIKEKFGTLRYYFESEYEYDSIERKIMQAITANAEFQSSIICEICGKYGSLDDSQYYIRTLCKKHKESRSELLLPTNLS